MSSVDRALAEVQAELSDHGLRNLVWWVEVATGDHIAEISEALRGERAYGLYEPDEHLIRIPPMSLRAANAFKFLGRRIGFHAPRESLRDVLRHEYGHALRDALGQMNRSSRLWGRDPCISAYAAKQDSATGRADEDFAEVFMLYLKHGGKLRHAQREHPRIAAKWSAMKLAIAQGAQRRLTVTVPCAQRSCGEPLQAVTGRVYVCPSCGHDLDLR